MNMFRTVSMMRVPRFGGRALLLIALSSIGTLKATHSQSRPRDLRGILTRSCSMTDAHFTLLDSGKIAVTTLKSRDKKEISLCGVVSLKRTSMPTIDELRESLSQRKNRSILAGGRFSEPPTRLDLQSLKLEKNDLDTLIQCKPRKCSLLVSDKLLQTLANSSNLRPGDLDDIYAEDLAEFASNFRTNGLDSLNIFEGLRITAPLAEQNRTMIGRVPLLAAFDPALTLYLKEYPNRVLDGAETTLGWSKISFGLKPIVTITSTTAYSPVKGGSPPMIITHQIYASRYMNGSVAMAVVVADAKDDFYLIFTDLSRSDSLGGLFSGIKRSIVSSDGTERLRELLEVARTRLEAPSSSQAAGTKPAPTNGVDRSHWSDWVNTIMVIAAIGALVVAIFGVRLFRRRQQPRKNARMYL